MRILSGSGDNTINIWNAQTGNIIKTIQGHTKSVLTVCYSSDGKRIISGSGDKTIKIWNAQTGNIIKTL